MDDYGISNPADDMRALMQSVGDVNLLIENLERLSTMLVMGLEEYLRAFSATRAIPQLVEVGRSPACAQCGDAITLLLRTVALVLENVPDSNAACSSMASELLSLSSFTLQNAPNLGETMAMSTCSALAEECLRVILFVARDDATGHIVANGFLREVLGVVDWADARITRQCFDIMKAVCDKINFISHQPPAAAKSHRRNEGTSNKHMISELVDRLIPQLHVLISDCSTMTHHFIVQEGAMQSLACLAVRAHRQQQPKVLSAIVTHDLFQAVFSAIIDDARKPENDRSAQLRVVHCMTVLMSLTMSAPAQFRQELLTEKAISLYSVLFNSATPEVFAKVLDDPFGTQRAVHPQSGATSSAVAAQRFAESEHNAAIMAFLCLAAALPPIPGAAFGKSLPISMTPVHRWMWEDDVHTFTEYPSDQWLLLETAALNSQSTVQVKVRGRTYEVNVVDLKQSSGRNICKSFVPEFFHLVQPGNPLASGTELPLPLADVHISKQDEAVLDRIYEAYISMVCEVCQRAASKLLKTSALWAAATLIHANLCVQQRAASATLMRKKRELTPVLCEMMVDAVSVPEEEAVPIAALGLSCMDWLLHNQPSGSSSLQFTMMCTRFGIPQALHVLLHFCTPECAQILVHAELLLSVFEASSSPVKASVSCETETLTNALQFFNDKRENSSVEVVTAALENVIAAVAASKHLTSFEFVNAGLAASLVGFLKGTVMIPVDLNSTPKKGSLGGQTPPSELTRKQRCQLLKNVIAQYPLALDILVRNLVAVIPFLCPLPLVESTVSAHAVTMRPVNEALTILASLSPRMAMCQDRAEDVAYLEQRSLLETDLESLCPNGHRLYNRIASGWMCDICSTPAGNTATASMRCDACDFDICFHCHGNPEIGYQGNLPGHEGEEGMRPGRTFHVLCSVGSVEKHFRKDGTLATPPTSSSSLCSSRVDCFYEGIGRCRMQESLLALLYRKAFSRKLTTVLEQFENSLLRIDAHAEQAAARQQQVTALVSLSSMFVEPSTEFDASGSGSPTGLVSPLRGLMFSTNRRVMASPNQTPAAARRLIDEDSAMRGVGRGITIREFGEQCVTKARTYFLHHFPTRKADRCFCGDHSRKDFATEHPPLLRQRQSPFECQPEVQLLLLLRELFFAKRSTPNIQSTTSEQRAAVFPEVCSEELAILVLKSVHASALRVAVLPFFFAVPRWVSFVVREAPFLLPLLVREKVARFSCYGAKRALWNHIRKLNLFPLRTPGGVAERIITPDEWHSELSTAEISSGHKFTVSRDSMDVDSLRVLEESSENRFPVTIEFQGDKGTGVGPTIHWFTMLAQRFVATDYALKYWRGDVTESDQTATVFTQSAEGLFPKIIPFERSEHDTELDALMSKPPQAKVLQTRLPSDSQFDDGVVENAVVGCLSLPLDSPPRIPAEDEAFFYMVGLAFGRALCDHRIVPSPLSMMMLEWLRVGPPPLFMLVPKTSTEKPNILSTYRLGIDDIALIDRSLAKSLTCLKKMLHSQRTSTFLADGSNSEVSSTSATPPASVESLDLVFTLPGHDSFLLMSDKHNGDPSETEPVTSDNLYQYIQRVCECVAFESVAVSIRSFWTGFTDVVQSEGLQMMELDELAVMLTGDMLNPTAPLWCEAELHEVLMADHGYTSDSLPFRLLFEVLSHDLTPQQQRRFLEFCTGCPRLPIGGLRAVGHITVVRRANEVSSSDDPSTPQPPGTAAAPSPSSEWPLPTVNTCFRYLKLPPYPTKELLQAKLLTAIEDNGGTFELS